MLAITNLFRKNYIERAVDDFIGLMMSHRLKGLTDPIKLETFFIKIGHDNSGSFIKKNMVSQILIPSIDH